MGNVLISVHNVFTLLLISPFIHVFIPSSPPLFFCLSPEFLLSQLYLACGNLRDGVTISSGVEEIMKRGRVTVEDSLGDGSDKMATMVSIYLTDLCSFKRS